MLKITNTALDHTKVFQRRRASKMVMEPVLFGRRLRLRTSMMYDGPINEHQQKLLDLYVQHGVISVEDMSPKKEMSSTPLPPPLVPEDPGVGIINTQAINKLEWQGEATVAESNPERRAEAPVTVESASTPVDAPPETTEGQPKKGKRKQPS